jgi:hypothetical protein
MGAECPYAFTNRRKKKNGNIDDTAARSKREENNLSTHRRGVILRGICGGAALKDKSPQISEDNTVITCGAELSIWDICAISSDAEAFGLQVKFGYDGHTRITFTPKEQPE